jgi:hypothetical protein
LWKKVIEKTASNYLNMLNDLLKTELEIGALSGGGEGWSSGIFDTPLLRCFQLRRGAGNALALLNVPQGNPLQQGELEHLKNVFL